MKRVARHRAAAVGAASILGLLGMAVVPLGGPAGATRSGPSKHVLLISIDGLHQSDLAQCEANHECPNLASLAGDGTTYTQAMTSEPSDSAPGTMGLLTGGDPKLTGVYYDDSYDRTMYFPAALTPTGTQDCSGAPGSETQYAENVDVGSAHVRRPQRDASDHERRLGPGPVPVREAERQVRARSAERLLAHQLGLQRGACGRPMDGLGRQAPGVQRGAGGERHAQRGGRSLQHRDQRRPDPAVARRHAGNTVNFPLDNPDGTGPYFITDSVGDTEAYDQIKVDAILNEIDGRNSADTARRPCRRSWDELPDGQRGAEAGRSVAVLRPLQQRRWV